MPKNSNLNEYIACQWPEYQKYMDKDWFLKESYYCADSDIYFIPKERFMMID